MKIISYNINGIRAAIRKGFADWLEQENPDVICLQEIKAMENQFDVKLFDELGYESFWYPAQKKGYSGVAILSKFPVENVKFGIDNQHFDNEGRVLQIDFEKVSIISLYLPSGTNASRLGYKFNFMDQFQLHIDNLKEKYPNLLICGDYNICHKSIDIHDPVRNKNVSGFLPEERLWLDKFISKGYIDSFRYFNPEPNKYSWWSYRANSREKNKGWRIDYIMVSESLEKKISQSFILNQIYHSDHCPIGIEIDL
ncbi:MAG: exodeoxyribonuclease III [Flavobacteriaceae bacterium]|nr:exodeoxyribonuclease III [Flavobacteriaceae bacterium]